MPPEHLHGGEEKQETRKMMQEILVAIRQAHLHVQREVAAVQDALRAMPVTYAITLAPKLQRAIELELVLANAIDDAEDMVKENLRLKTDRDFNIRRQKQWRIMACQACIGGVNVDDVIRQAFLDFVTEPPPDQELDDELARLVVQLEAREKATAEFGTLREIMLK